MYRSWTVECEDRRREVGQNAERRKSFTSDIPIYNV